MVSELGRGRLKIRQRMGRDHTLSSAPDLDRNRLAALYDQFSQPIYTYVYRQVGDVETARDLVAEVFHRLVRAAHKGNCPNSNPRAWLYRTAHNLVIDHYRRQTHRRHLSLDEELASSSDSMQATVDQRFSAAQIRRALSNLTSEQRQVIVLKFLEGLTNKEVATILDKTVGSVKALQHRALAALKRQLEPDKDGMAK